MGSGTIKGRNIGWENLGKRPGRIRACDTGGPRKRTGSWDGPAQAHKQLGRLVSFKESSPLLKPKEIKSKFNKGPRLAFLPYLSFAAGSLGVAAVPAKAQSRKQAGLEQRLR